MSGLAVLLLATLLSATTSTSTIFTTNSSTSSSTVMPSQPGCPGLASANQARYPCPR